MYRITDKNLKLFYPFSGFGKKSVLPAYFCTEETEFLFKIQGGSL